MSWGRWTAETSPWIKTETDHHYGTRKKVEDERFFMSKSCACPCFRRRSSEETEVVHGQRWAISESEKEARWKANQEKFQEMLRKDDGESENLDVRIDKAAQEETEMQQLLPTQEETNPVTYGAIDMAA